MTQKSIFSNKVGHPVKAKAQSNSSSERYWLYKKKSHPSRIVALLGEGTFHPLPLPACSFIIFECFMTK